MSKPISASEANRKFFGVTCPLTKEGSYATAFDEQGNNKMGKLTRREGRQIATRGRLQVRNKLGENKLGIIT